MTDQLSRVFAALADPTRRDMVARLATGDATVGELAEPYDVSVQAVSKHVKVLADAGLVSQRRDAQRHLAVALLQELEQPRVQCVPPVQAHRRERPGDLD